MKEKILDWYRNHYPTDNAWLDEKATFKDLFDIILEKQDVYKVIDDSLVRKRLFEHLAELTGKKYETIYAVWANGKSALLEKSFVMDSVQEFQYILDFIVEFSNSIDNELEKVVQETNPKKLWQYNLLYQLKSLWTAYCLHNDLQCDTYCYDDKITKLFNKVKECNPSQWKDEDFNDFDLWFGSYIC